ncbi:hypothetical protein GN244_ATG15262 [Phytophthora infestans]|uniref:Uncharacterized protein n=1 Tax=Phytophthora infestans TaxID=4787 RepID=A0A833WPB7_PHYIN|nr:hypothetical protein GN244_ATG15262 [Phytophthora infestans]
MERDWRAEYSIKTPVDSVLSFLDLLLTEEGGEWWTKLHRRAQRIGKRKSDDQEPMALNEEDKQQLKTFKKRLAVVGGQLVIKLPELNASLGSNESPRIAKVHVLLLQLVCRVLYYGVLTQKKKEEKKRLKKEIRGLMDRVALLLDAANPPSLADEDADERSPFQEFLQHDLAPRVQMLQPGLV